MKTLQKRLAMVLATSTLALNIPIYATEFTQSISLNERQTGSANLDLTIDFDHDINTSNWEGQLTIIGGSINQTHTIKTGENGVTVKDTSITLSTTLPIDTYKIILEANGYTSYESEVNLQSSSKQLTLSTSGEEFNFEFSTDDVLNNMNAVLYNEETGETQNSKYDVNKDFNVDVLDLAYTYWSNGGASIQEISTLLPSAVIAPTNLEAGTVISGNLADIIDPYNTQPVTMELDDNGNAIIPIGFTEAQDISEILVTVPLGQDINDIDILDENGISVLEGIEVVSTNARSLETTIKIKVNKKGVTTLKIIIRDEAGKKIMVTKIKFYIGDSYTVDLDKVDDVEVKPRENGLKVEWDDVKNANEYRVVWGLAEDGVFTDYAYTKNDKLTISGLAGGATYQVGVIAVNGDAEGKMSDIVYATTNESTTTPDAPKNFSVSGVVEGINVSFDRVSNATSYDLYYSTSEDGEYTKVSGISNNFTLTGLEANQRYYAYVKAVNNVGESKATSIRSATTKEATVAPNAPTNLVVTVNGNSIDVKFDTKDASSATVYYNEVGTDNQNAKVSSISGTTITDLKYETQYEVYATAQNGAGVSSATATVIVTTEAEKITVTPPTEEEANKGLLKIAINNAELALEDVYTSIDGNDVPNGETWATSEAINALKSELGIADVVFADQDATTEEVTNATASLNTAIASFNDATTQAVVNKSSLSIALNVATTMSAIQVSEDGTDIYEEDYWVTPAVMNEFTTAQAEANTVNADQKTTQNSVDLATANLNAHINAVNEAKQLGTNPEKSEEAVAQELVTKAINILLTSTLSIEFEANATTSQKEALVEAAVIAQLGDNFVEGMYINVSSTKSGQYTITVGYTNLYAKDVVINVSETEVEDNNGGTTSPEGLTDRELVDQAMYITTNASFTIEVTDNTSDSAREKLVENAIIEALGEFYVSGLKLDVEYEGSKNGIGEYEIEIEKGNAEREATIYVTEITEETTVTPEVDTDDDDDETSNPDGLTNQQLVDKAMYITTNASFTIEITDKTSDSSRETLVEDAIISALGDLYTPSLKIDVDYEGSKNGVGEYDIEFKKGSKKSDDTIYVTEITTETEEDSNSGTSNRELVEIAMYITTNASLSIEVTDKTSDNRRETLVENAIITELGSAYVSGMDIEVDYKSSKDGVGTYEIEIEKGNTEREATIYVTEIMTEGDDSDKTIVNNAISIIKEAELSIVVTDGMRDSAKESLVKDAIIEVLGDAYVSGMKIDVDYEGSKNGVGEYDIEVEYGDEEEDVTIYVTETTEDTTTENDEEDLSGLSQAELIDRAIAITTSSALTINVSADSTNEEKAAVAETMIIEILGNNFVDGMYVAANRNGDAQSDSGVDGGSYNVEFGFKDDNGDKTYMKNQMLNITEIIQ
ncbi:MAG: hypothetical protein ATN36_04300 [Epulopiscium sp. Nele67-Bin005]|nr:MAG: hypothetical protein ATN36_04300 [Epulopiscium sp. Nele67-Bin005]